MTYSNRSVYIFLDCNTALHFRRADQINWCELSKSKHVTLVIAPIFLRELEHQKIINKSKKLRQRAEETIRWLGQYVDSGNLNLRSGVDIEFIDHEPMLNFEQHRLSEIISDDHLIASVIDYRFAHENDRILVATADIGLRLKIRARNIEILAPPESERLPTEPDPLEKELSDLRRDNEILRRRIPRLELRFNDCGHEKSYILRQPDISVQMIAAAQARSKSKPIFEDPVNSGLVIRGFVFARQMTIDEIKFHNQQVSKFDRELDDYLAKLQKWSEQFRLIFRVELVLANIGSAKANDIDVEMDLPNDVFACEEADLPTEPTRPEPPSVGGFSHASYREALDFRLGSVKSFSDILRERDIPQILIGQNGKINFKVPHLKHGYDKSLPNFFICLNELDSSRKFAAKYRISAEEIIDSIEGQLIFDVSL